MFTAAVVERRDMTRGTGKSGTRQALFGAAAASVAILLGTSASHAQVMVMEAPATADEDPNNPNKRQGFTVPTDESLQTNFSDFERHVERKTWEKAFATLNEIPAEKRTGMLSRKDGVVIPAQQRIWEAIAALPADGRDAFRVFYDAKARQTWQPVADGAAPLDEQVSIAEKIYQEFFLSTVGDNAADLLGDSAFEQGDFESADRYWKSVLEKHPDSELSEERLLFKRGLAMAQMGQSSSAETVRRTLVQRYGGKTVRIGATESDPAEFLAKAIAKIQTPAAAQLAANPAVYTAPAADTKPLWRTQFVTPKLNQQMESTMRNNYWYRNGMETLVPATASDGERIFCNWFGICFASDIKTGKILWRSQKFTDLSNHIGNLPHSASNLEQYALSAGNGIVVALSLPIDRLNYWQEPFRLFCYDAVTGKEKWKTLDNSTLNNTSFIGPPLIDGDVIYAIGHGREEAKIALHCLNLNGQPQWSTDLGTAKKRPTPRGYEVMPQPMLLRRGRTLFIATQDGALVSFDLDERKIRWLLTYEGPESGQSSRFVYSGAIDDVTQLHTRTALMEYEGILYVKEAGSRELVAIDPSGPSIVWKRPVEKAAQLVAVDKDAVYTLDTELSSYDRQDKKLRWANRLPIAAGGLSAIVGKDSVLVLTSRGLFQLDRSTGDTKKIFRGADLAAAGGKLHLIGEQIVAVTTLSVTSYGDSATQSAEGK